MIPNQEWSKLPEEIRNRIQNPPLLRRDGYFRLAGGGKVYDEFFDVGKDPSKYVVEREFSKRNGTIEITVYYSPFKDSTKKVRVTNLPRSALGHIPLPVRFKL